MCIQTVAYLLGHSTPYKFSTINFLKYCNNLFFVLIAQKIIKYISWFVLIFDFYTIYKKKLSSFLSHLILELLETTAGMIDWNCKKFTIAIKFNELIAGTMFQNYLTNICVGSISNAFKKLKNLKLLKYLLATIG